MVLFQVHQLGKILFFTYKRKKDSSDYCGFKVTLENGYLSATLIIGKIQTVANLHACLFVAVSECSLPRCRTARLCVLLPNQLRAKYQRYSIPLQMCSLL